MVARGRPQLLWGVSASRGPDLSGPGAAEVTPRTAGEAAVVCMPEAGTEATGLIACEDAIDGIAMTILSFIKNTPIRPGWFKNWTGLLRECPRTLPNGRTSGPYLAFASNTEEP